jgi:hypothetical protein
VNKIRTNYVRIELTVGAKGNARVPHRSGLNWGQRPRRNQNQAYLKVPSAEQQNGFFPDKGINFNVTCDDGRKFICKRAQGDYGKAIETPHNNAILGEYFRMRIGVESGEAVLLSDLLAYGRTNVDIFKDDHLEYYLDFSKH